MNTAPINKLRKSWRVHERAATETCLTGIFQRNLECVTCVAASPAA